MKNINFFTGVLLVLVGFCAGVAFNVIPMSTAAQGPPATPPAALKVVAHDSTLTGDGTMTVPLGIANGGVRTGQLANGAVTAPKLSAAPGPSVGQVLGFNGANLAWQNAPVGGARVVDSRGQVVGPLVYYSSVMRQLGGFDFQLSVGKNGFGKGNVQLYHTTVDCSGTRYMPGDGNGLFRQSENTSTLVFYAADPLQQITVNSVENIYAPFDLSRPGECVRFNPTPISAGLVATFDLSTLGLAPPFRLQF